MKQFTDKHVNKNPYSDISPVVCGYGKCKPGHSYGPAVRTYWILHFVVSGKGVLEYKGGRRNVGKNEIFIIRPYEINTYTADKDDPWEYIWIGFRAGITLTPQFMTQDIVYAPELHRAFNDCINAPEKSGYEAFLCSRIWEIIASLSKDDNPTEAFEMYIKPAMNIIEAEYYKKIKVSDIAERLHIDRSYFTSLFKKVTGKSPHEYLSDLRMEKAIKLMNTHGYSVTVTSNSVGYPDVFAFSRAFKNYYGISPTDYMKKVQIRDIKTY